MPRTRNHAPSPRSTAVKVIIWAESMAKNGRRKKGSDGSDPLFLGSGIPVLGIQPLHDDFVTAGIGRNLLQHLASLLVCLGGGFLKASDSIDCGIPSPKHLALKSDLLVV